MEFLKRLYKYFVAMSLKKKILCIGLLFAVILLLSNCKLIYYGAEQGIGQIRLINNAEPIETVLQDPEFPDSLKQKLILLSEIRKFAMDSLKLNNSKNYTTVYDQKGRPIVWIVYGSKPYKMEPYLWRFPVVGKVPYKGFFKKRKAEKEAEKLKKKGYDVRVGTVSAWSTLGYFKDPVLSGMLKRNEGQLAELIIHELTHSTIFVKGESELNENIATFIGQEGAKSYLISKYGKGTDPYNAYIGKLNDSKKFANHVLRGAKKLDSLYVTFNHDYPKTQKDSLKTIMIEAIIDDLDTVNFEQSKIKQILKKKRFVPNNAFFVGYITYHNKLELFYEEYENHFNSDLIKYIKHLENKYN